MSDAEWEPVTLAYWQRTNHLKPAQYLDPDDSTLKYLLGQNIDQTDGTSYRLYTPSANPGQDASRGLEIPPLFYNLAIELRQGIQVGVDPSPLATESPYVGDLRHDGLSVGVAGTHVFEFQWHTGLLPATFYAKTAEYGKFKISNIELRVTPKKGGFSKTAPGDGLTALATIASGVTSGESLFTASGLPASAIGLLRDSEGAISGFKQEKTNAMFTHFNVDVHKFQWSASSNTRSLQGQHWRLWNRIFYSELRFFPTTPTGVVYGAPMEAETKLPLRDLYERNGACVCENKEMVVNRQPMEWTVKARAQPLYGPFGSGWQSAYTSTKDNVPEDTPYAGAAATSVADEYSSKLPSYAIAADHLKPVGWVEIPPGGYYTPGSYAFQGSAPNAPPGFALNSTVVGGAKVTSLPASAVVQNQPPALWTPMGQMIVDTNEWTLGDYFPKWNAGDQPVGNMEFDKLVQCYRPSQDIDPLRPSIMNPPLEWDVYYIVDVEFTGKNAQHMPASASFT